MTQAIDRFIVAAADYGTFTENANYKSCNMAYDRAVVAVAELKKLPDRGQSLLEGLLVHGDTSVRSWAASYLLPLNEASALCVLLNVASGSGLIAFTAGMVVKEWKAGRLKLIQYSFVVYFIELHLI